MALFKKKKKKIEEPEEPTPVVEAKAREKPKELSPEAKRLIAFIEMYKKEYYGVFRIEDLAGLEPNTEMMNLLFAIFAELRTLNDQMSRALEDE